MIDPEMRRAVYLLHEQGTGIRKISRLMNIDKDTVREIIRLKGAMPDKVRKDKIELDPDLLRRLYNECNGWVQRVHEKLEEEEGIRVGYSTLTRRIRELGIGESNDGRCDKVPDKPGKEMQHDTSPYHIKIGSKEIRVEGSLLYFRYSKTRYLKFFRGFNRFKMKCFFHEALTFWGYAAENCIIDNTNLARLRGTGKNAVICLEMERFLKQFGSRFVCHEVGHANRKAGNERSFWTVETNFFPGRTFESLEDLNRQAFEWATKRWHNRPMSKTKLIPAKAFEFEKAYLVKLPPYVPRPYLIHERGTDQYGYAPLDGNFYWVPGTGREDVKILEYSDSIEIYLGRKKLVEYELPPDGVKNEEISPPGLPRPKYKPSNRKRPTREEEKRLRAISEEVDAYLNFALPPMGRKKHRFLRELFALSRKLAAALFIKTIRRALKYRIVDMGTIERIAFLEMNNESYEMPHAEIDGDFKNRESYLEGRLTDEPDLSVYDDLLEEEEDG